jgi:hypothetical protein
VFLEIISTMFMELDSVKFLMLGPILLGWGILPAQRNLCVDFYLLKFCWKYNSPSLLKTLETLRQPNRNVWDFSGRFREKKCREGKNAIMEHFAWVEGLTTDFKWIPKESLTVLCENHGCGTSFLISALPCITVTFLFKTKTIKIKITKILPRQCHSWVRNLGPSTKGFLH